MPHTTSWQKPLDQPGVSYRDALADRLRSIGPAEQLKDLITDLFTPAHEHGSLSIPLLIMDEDGLVHVTPDCPGCRRCVRSPEFTIQDEDSPLYD